MLAKRREDEKFLGWIPLSLLRNSMEISFSRILILELLFSQLTLLMGTGTTAAEPTSARLVFITSQLSFEPEPRESPWIVFGRSTPWGWLLLLIIIITILILISR